MSESDPRKYTVGWICAIKTELVAAKAFFDEEHDQLDKTDDNDNNIYALGRVGKHNVVVASLPKWEYGLVTAATVARDMLRSFPNVRFGLMVGIAGGAPSKDHDIRLGDVVVSGRDAGTGGVLQYDYGKTIQNQAFEQTGFLNQPPQLLLAAMASLEADYDMKGHQLNEAIEGALKRFPKMRKKYSRPSVESDRLYQSHFVHPASSSGECSQVCSNDPNYLVQRTERDENEDDPVIHYGVIASANQLMKNAKIRDKMAAKRGVLCFEMEAAGLMNHFPCLVIRGICDYSDTHKNTEWQGFAAMMAAGYAKDLLRQIPPGRVEAERPIQDLLSSVKERIDRLFLTTDETKEAVVSVKSDHDLAKIERWLSPPDYSTNANSARARRHAGTGTWFLESDSFKEWKSGSRRHLWLSGLAGSGKTVLTTTILDNLWQRDTHTTLTFFFDFNDSRKQTLNSLLKGLAFQLHRLGGESASQLDALFASHDNGQTQPETGALSDCVEAMMQSASRVVVVLDALDECTTRKELLSWLLGAATAPGGAQLLVTSRPEPEFQSNIPDIFNEANWIVLNKNAVNLDIRNYVTMRLQHDKAFVEKNLSNDLQQSIRDKVGNGADGMFRWAACQLDSLTRHLKHSAIKRALESLPRDLNETYERMFRSIPPESEKDAIRLLQFLVYTQQPLSLEEAIEVVATEIDQGPRSFDTGNRINPPTEILRICPSFIVLVEVEPGITEVHLAHFSVKEYLLGKEQFSLESASIAITETCLSYLTDIEGSDVEQIKRNFPMALYAAKAWGFHAYWARTSKDLIRAILCFFQAERTYERWDQIYRTPIPDVFIPVPMRMRPKRSKLYYACEFGLLGVAQGLFEMGADANAPGFDGYPLETAVENCHWDCVDLLVDKEPT